MKANFRPQSYAMKIEMWDFTIGLVSIIYVRKNAVCQLSNMSNITINMISWSEIGKCYKSK